jgi:hypothetical protein
MDPINETERILSDLIGSAGLKRCKIESSPYHSERPSCRPVPTL